MIKSLSFPFYNYEPYQVRIFYSPLICFHHDRKKRVPGGRELNLKPVHSKKFRTLKKLVRDCICN